MSLRCLALPVCVAALLVWPGCKKKAPPKPAPPPRPAPAPSPPPPSVRVRPRLKAPPGTPEHLAKAFEALRADDPAVRADAARRLATAEEKAAFAASQLARLLNDETEVKIRAVQALTGDEGPEGETSVLITTTPGEMAGYALAKMGDRGRRPLTDALRSSRPAVRRNAARAFGQMRVRDVRLARTLATRLKDPDIGVRRAAAASLGHFGSPEVLGALRKALDDPEVRDVAVISYAIIGGEKVVDELIGMMETDDVKFLCGLVRALGTIKRTDRIFEPLGRAIRNERLPEVRKAAAWALGRRADKRTTGYLLSRTNDPDRQVRREVFIALARIADRKALAPLAKAARDKTWDMELRRACLRALGEMRTLAALREVAAIARAVRKQEAEMRRVAVAVLGLSGDRQAIAPLIEALRDPNRAVRRQAAGGLAHFGDAAVLPLIRALRKMPTDEGRRVIADTLKAITKQDLGPDPAVWYKWYRTRKRR